MNQCKMYVIYGQKAEINTVLLECNVPKAFNPLYLPTKPLSITDIKPAPHNPIGSGIGRSGSSLE